MLENRIKINSIVRNQLPEYVKDEFPLVEEFLSQYYLSLENKGNPSDIIQNIDQYVKVDYLSDLIYETTLSQDITLFANEILVTSTLGFPDRYGLLLINDEIILYESKTDIAFLNCFRGFSGITSHSNKITDQLIFKTTNSSSHNSGSTVTNLSVLFLREFFKKLKTQITPGFESSEFFDGLNENLFIKQSIDFYKSKGTESSFKILFGALYGNPAKVILPRDFLIQPSDAQYRITQDLVVESISGNPEDLVNGTLYQDETNNYSFARGTISDVGKIIRGDKVFYKISLDSGYDKDIDVFGSLKSNFKIHAKTIVTSDIQSGSSYIDVDSTIGFPDSGSLILKIVNELELVTTLSINYTSKVSNQFLGCSGITLDISKGVEVTVTDFCYGYDRDGNIVSMRITGVNTDFDIPDTTKYYKKNDPLKIKTLGEDSDNFIQNNWIFNIPVKYTVKSQELISQNLTRILLYDDHSFNLGDIVDILYTIESEENILSGVVQLIENGKTIIISTSQPVSSIYEVRKKVSKVSSQISDINIYSTNVQNVYVDYDNNTYVTSSSLPSYLNQNINVNDLSITLPSNLLDRTEGYEIEYVGHKFYTGDSVVFVPGNKQVIFNGNILEPNSKTLVYVSRIDSRRFKLSYSREKIFKNEFIDIIGNISDSKIYLSRFSNSSLNQLSLKPQNIFKKFESPSNFSENDISETQPGSIGIFANGVEILNYKSIDQIYYGSIEEVVVTSEGEGYDLINPPKLEILDPLGENAKGYCSIIGNLERIDIINPGFDYITNPLITIRGGNGYGAEVQPRMGYFDHYAEFDASQTFLNNTIEFYDSHKFRDSEKVFYINDGNSSISGISTEEFYYVQVVDFNKIKLHRNELESANKTNEISLGSGGVGVQKIKSFNKKKKISSIDIVSPGVNYQNKKTFVNSVNSASNILTIKNHGYLDEEIIVYYPEGTPIVGLTSSKSYYVTKISDNEIKLSEIGPENNKNQFYKEKKYINLRSSITNNQKHFFNYEPITLSVSGLVGVQTSSAYAELRPIFKGSIQSVSLENGGVGYGSSEIINLNRQPTFMIIDGSGSQITPVIEDGKIVDVVIQSPGLNYESLPDLVIDGDGIGAVLTPIFSDGSISEVKVISTGIGYSREKTRIRVEYSGQNAKFEALIKSWRVNLFSRYLESELITADDGFISRGLDELQYLNIYPARKLREIIYSSNYKSDLSNDTTLHSHSPILGWAYDGNPIYGPYGYSTLESPEIKQIKSSYIRKRLPNRPSSYPLGFFIEDYVYNGGGDLDESNGRFCVTPEFPNGVYAYFCTFGENLSTRGIFRGYKIPEFPYVIGNVYKNKPIIFNFNQSSKLDEKYIFENKLLRNTTPYNLKKLNSNYEFLYIPDEIKEQNLSLKSVDPGYVDSIKIISPGQNYGVNDAIIFDDDSVGGFVSRISGNGISSITYFPVVNTFEFIPYRSKFIGVSTIPHNFYSNSFATLYSDYEYEKYGKVDVVESRLVLRKDIGNSNFTGPVATLDIQGNSLGYPITENDYYKLNDEIVKILNIDTKSSKLRVLRSQFDTVGLAHSAGDVLESASRKILFDAQNISSSYNLKLNKEYYFDPSTSVGIGAGINTSLLLETYKNNTNVQLIKGINTKVYFNNQSDYLSYKFGGYVEITNASNSNWNIDNVKIVSVGDTSITIDLDSTSFVDNSVTAVMNKWKFLDIQTRAIYLPNHTINTGDTLFYRSNGGTRISVSTDGVTSNFLTEDSPLYALKISNDLIGLSLQPTDNDSDILYFSGLGTSNYHSLVTNYQNIFVGDLKQNQIIVNTESNHNLQINDLVEFDVQVGISKTFKVEFNSTNRRIVINAKDIQDVNIENNTVIVESHEFKTGQKLIYETTNTIGGLINNQIYYAVIIDDNTIKLSQYLSDSKKESPVVINLTSSGSGRLMPINPEISILKYQNIIFDISDESLAFRDNSAFELKFYEDEKFNNEFLSAKITKNGQIGIGTTSTIKLETTNLNKSIYYNFVPLYSNSSSTQKLVYVDSELGTNNKISIEDSILNSTHKVVGGGLTSFIFTTVKSLEHAVYDSTNSNLKYYTNSRTSSGPISKISVNSKKKLYNNLPYVKDIISSFGENAILESESSTIGKIKSDDIKLDDYGFNYSIDRSIRPKYKFPDILRISPLYVFDRIEIIDNGKNYISPPNLIAIDPINGNLIEDVILYYDFDLQNVQILKNTQGIGKFEPIILPVNNDNGITISFIEYDSLTNSVTVTISAEYNNINDFPFSIGDLVIIEDVLVEEGGKGYNSEEYNYKPFVIDYIDPNIGGTNGSIRFSLNDYLLPEEYPGIYDNRIVKGKIVPQSYFPKFKTYLKRINFLNNEEVKTLSNSGFVVGFDFDNNILRVSTDGEFSIGETIVGQSSNIKAIIVDIFSAESYINVGPNVTVESGFNKETGLLNNDRQRLHDNDYYQYFSYSVESETDYSTWSDEVDRLNHTAGFKKFSNLNIQQADSVETGLLYNQDFGNFYAESLSPEVINLNCYHDFDLVTENSFEISSKLKSNEIYFESRIISDYIESKGNRVLLIDDISDKFTTSERRPYQVIDQFEFLDIRFKKYFIHIMDVLDPSRSEFSVVSLLNSQNEGYINNYAIISSEDSIGYYDYTTSLDRYGQLIYYPTITDRKIYKFNIFSYDIGDVVGAATTTLFIGDIGNVSYVTGIKTENSTQPVSLVGLTTTRQDSCKYLVTITDDSNSYYEYYELNTVNDNGTLNVSMYGDLSTGSPLPDVSVGLVTFSSEIQNDNIVLNVHPSQTSIASSFRVNAVVTSIASTSIQNGSVEVGGNLLQSNFISTSITGPEPEKKLIFSYSSDFTSTYNLIVINDKTNNEIEFLELTTLLNNTNQQSFIVEYGNLSTNNSIGIFECEISDLTGDYELYFTPNQNIDYEMRILKALIGIEEQTGIAVI